MLVSCSAPVPAAPNVSVALECRAIRNRPDPFGSEAHAANNTFRILSLDGGGIRGVLTTVILARIEKEFPHFIEKHVDLIAGSSTGGLIGLLLAAGYTPAECVEIYKVCNALLLVFRGSR